jgi:2-keto-3-deoxy-L-rhamnonate aldolase RhmA
MVRISEGNLTKGLVFGVLDVAKREIIWLEMPFTAQTLRGADSASIEALLRRLENKVTIGQLLDIKAQAQHLTLVENVDEADEAYTYEWALNPAEVTKLLAG